jgi:hypothetical protein
VSYACDIDPPEFYAEAFPTAAKQHWCCECNAPIERGEKHLYARGKNEGQFWDVRQHIACREICMAIKHEDDCICFGELKEWWDASGRDLPRHHRLRSLMAIVIRRERSSRKRFHRKEA